MLIEKVADSDISVNMKIMFLFRIEATIFFRSALLHRTSNLPAGTHISIRSACSMISVHDFSQCDYTVTKSLPFSGCPAQNAQAIHMLPANNYWPAFSSESTGCRSLRRFKRLFSKHSNWRSQHFSVSSFKSGGCSFPIIPLWKSSGRLLYALVAPVLDSCYSQQNFSITS